MSVATEISRLQTAKSDIKTAIEAKGVTVPSSAKIDVYDDYIAQISTGKEKKYDNVLPGVYYYMIDGTLMTQSEYTASQQSSGRDYPNFIGRPIGIAVISSLCKFVVSLLNQGVHYLYDGSGISSNSITRHGLIIHENLQSALSSTDYNGYKQNAAFYKCCTPSDNPAYNRSVYSHSLGRSHLPTVAQARLIQNNWNTISSMCTDSRVEGNSLPEEMWTCGFVKSNYNLYIDAYTLDAVTFTSSNFYTYSLYNSDDERKTRPIFPLDYDYENMEYL